MDSKKRRFSFLVAVLFPSGDYWRYIIMMKNAFLILLIIGVSGCVSLSHVASMYSMRKESEHKGIIVNSLNVEYYDSIKDIGEVIEIVLASITLSNIDSPALENEISLSILRDLGNIGKFQTAPAYILKVEGNKSDMIFREGRTFEVGDCVAYLKTSLTTSEVYQVSCADLNK